jgi:hypothetical protein
VAPAATLAQQRGGPSDPAMCASVVDMPRCEQTVRQRLGKTPRVSKGSSMENLRKAKARPKVASAATLAQQAGRADDPEVRLVVVYMP